MGKISIIIPNFNNAQWLIKTIASCIEQGAEYIKEIIIIDDFSSDDSWEILLENQRLYPQLVKVYKNKFTGSNNARNYGFELSTGDFIQWLDSDDQLLPGKFKAQLDVFDKNPNADIVYSDWQMDHYINGKFKKTDLFPNQQHDDFLYQLLSNKWVPPNNYLHKREIVERTIKMNGWNPQTFLAQDREYITISAIIGAKFVYTPGFFAIYNRWSLNTISQVGHKRAIVSALTLEEHFYNLIKEQPHIDNRKKRAYQRVKHYKLVSPFNVSPSFAHYKLSPFLPLILLFSWVKYFFGEIFNPIEVMGKVYKKANNEFKYYLIKGHSGILSRDEKQKKEIIAQEGMSQLDAAMTWLKFALPKAFPCVILFTTAGARLILKQPAILSTLLLIIINSQETNFFMKEL
jgi:glycosyltransferase involved in cell wall biosynthesis